MWKQVMTKYSPVAPVEVLLQMKERGFLDNYLLVLAHEVVTAPTEYKKLFQDFQGTIILDNSLIELGKPADASMMLLAASIINPTYVVMPDALCDSQLTIDLSKEAMNTWGKKLPRGTGFMLAAQGVDVADAAMCIRQITEEHSKASPDQRNNYLIGIPRVLTNKFGSRMPFVQGITSMGHQVHLLGMSEDLTDDMQCTRLNGVVGIDSASPLRAGWENKIYNHGDTSELRNRQEYFDSCRGFNLVMAYNVGLIRGMIKGH